VESFATAAGDGEKKGTVRANADTQFCTATCPPTCGYPRTVDPDACTGAAAWIDPSLDTEDYSGCMPCCA